MFCELFLDDSVHLFDCESIFSGDIADTKEQQLAIVV